MGSEKKVENKTNNKKKNVGADNLQPVDVDNVTCRLRQADSKLGENQGSEKSDKTKSNQNLSASTDSEIQGVDSDTFQNLNVIFYTVAGDRYEGEVNEEGEPHGQGTFYYDEGGFYSGEFVNGKAHGQGTFFYPDLDFYKEEHEDGHAKSLAE